MGLSKPIRYLKSVEPWEREGGAQAPTTGMVRNFGDLSKGRSDVHGIGDRSPILLWNTGSSDCLCPDHVFRFPATPLSSNSCSGPRVRSAAAEQPGCCLLYTS